MEKLKTNGGKKKMMVTKPPVSTIIPDAIAKKPAIFADMDAEIEKQMEALKVQRNKA